MTSTLTPDLSETALAFRGYNVTNLGRTAELYAVEAYRPILREELDRYSTLCEPYAQRSVDLTKMVVSRSEPGLERYAEAISLVAAVEEAQIRLLREVHGIDIQRALVTFGYSLGELLAVGFGGSFSIQDMIRIPLLLAQDSVDLADKIKMGVLFSRGPKILESMVSQLCQKVSAEGHGTIGISAILSPNTYLLIGQDQTVERFKEMMPDVLPPRAHLRLNSNQWPPLHTPIVWQRNIVDRASVLMQSLPGGFTPPSPPVLSMVTGEMSYDDHSARDILRDWVHRPQRLWDVIDKTLVMGVETVVHIGPQPNVIPATFRRLSENVRQQTSGSSLASIGTWAARRQWLSSLLPSDVTLLRAPYVRHVILEDWLIENSGNAP